MKRFQLFSSICSFQGLKIPTMTFRGQDRLSPSLVYCILKLQQVHCQQRPDYVKPSTKGRNTIPY